MVKNTLTKIAAQEAGVSAFDTLLQGPSAIAFVKGDPVEAAKGLRDFAKAHPLLVIKGGVLDGKTMSPDEIRKLADLESREVLLGQARRCDAGLVAERGLPVRRSVEPGGTGHGRAAREGRGRSERAARRSRYAGARGCGRARGSG